MEEEESGSGNEWESVEAEVRTRRFISDFKNRRNTGQPRRSVRLRRKTDAKTAAVKLEKWR
jgi:hypothetical protein